MTYVVDEDSMECVMREAPGDWVSHSFAQYILSDGEYVYRLDLGDGNPRAVNLAKSVAYQEPDDVVHMVWEDRESFPVRHYRKQG